MTSSAQYLILDLETCPDPSLSEPLVSERLRDLLAKMPPCFMCGDPAEWAAPTITLEDEVRTLRPYCEPCGKQTRVPQIPLSHGGVGEQIREVRAELRSKVPPFGKPAQHQIVCVGYAWLDDYAIVSSHQGGFGCFGLPPGDTELDAIKKTTEALQHTQPTLVTFNGRCFDLPVLASRALHHGVPFPWYWEDKPRYHHARYRYAETKHLDVMDLLSNNGAAKATSQDVWARACGLPGKAGTSGNQVASLHAANKHDEIGAYCLSDVLQLTGIFLRTQLTRGVLPLPRYRAAAASLWEAMGGDERTRWVATETDLDRFLMREPLTGREEDSDAERSAGGGADAGAGGAAARAPGGKRSPARPAARKR